MEMAIKNNKTDIAPLLRYSSLGLEMGLSVVIGITIGYYLDKFFNTSPYLMILFMLFGVAAAAKTVVTLIRKAKKDERENNR